jgi:putative cell wall-binding protein
VLLTPPDKLSANALHALQALNTRIVYLVGDATAISGDVEAELRRNGFDTFRFGGATRYDTAAAVAAANDEGIGSLGTLGRTAIVVSGETFPDAIASGPLSFAKLLPILLTPPDRLASQTDRALSERRIQHVVIVGGEVAVQPQVEAMIRAKGISVQRVAGQDRTATAVAMAEFLASTVGWSMDHVNLARGDAFPDAVAGGPHGGRELAPIVLTVDPTTLGAATKAFLERHRGEVAALHAFGDRTAISDAVLEEAQASSS